MDARKVSPSDQNLPEEVKREFKAPLLLYEKRRRRSVSRGKLFLARNLSYVALTRPYPLRKGLKQSTGKSPLGDLFEQRKRTIPSAKFGRLQLEPEDDEIDLSSGARFVLTIVGLRGTETQINKLRSRSKCVCLYVSLYAHSGWDEDELLESYEVFAPTISSAEDLSHLPQGLVELPFSYNFGRRKVSESLYLIIHAYSVNASVAPPEGTVRGVVNRFGPLVKDCSNCQNIRNSFREVTSNSEGLFFTSGIDLADAPHLFLPPHACRKDTTVTRNSLFTCDATFKIRIWNHQTLAQHVNYMKLDATTTSKDVYRGIYLEMSLQWERNLSFRTPSLGPCCESLLNTQVRRRRKFTTTVNLGLRFAEDQLPLTLGWILDGKPEPVFKQTLTTFRCPICQIVTGSWQGLFVHFKASHDRLDWSHVTSSQISVRTSPIVLLGGSGEATSSLPKDLFPTRRKFFKAKGCFEPISGIDEDSSSDESQDMKNDIVRKKEIEERMFAQYCDVSEEESQVMVLWNAFVRRHQMHLGPRGFLPGTRITKELLCEFVDENVQTIKTNGLEANIILLFTTLFDFGLISNHLALYAAAYLRSATG